MIQLRYPGYGGFVFVFSQRGPLQGQITIGPKPAPGLCQLILMTAEDSLAELSALPPHPNSN